MSEPTPLSAEELAELRSRVWPRNEDGESVNWCNLCGFGWPCGCTKMLATIDAQATEIAGLRGALEREKRSEWREGLVAVIDHEGNYLGCMGTMTWAVLAGKEAQCPKCEGRGFIQCPKCEGRGFIQCPKCEGRGFIQCPKCEGRGFIRTMVDGERDSEPCSFCRMSGLAGKEAQG